MSGNTLDEAWERACYALAQMNLGPASTSFISMVKPLGDVQGTILLAAPNEFTKNYIETKVRRELSTALSQALGHDTRIAVTVDPDLDVFTPTSSPEPPTPHLSQPEPVPSHTTAAHDVAKAPQPLSANEDYDRVEADRLAALQVPAPRQVDTLQQDSPTQPLATPLAKPDAPVYTTTDTHLNPKFTFDTFVPGASTRFAHAAALAAAEYPGRSYNPLFIYGDSGLGKTHLLHAIGNYALSMSPRLKVRYVNSEEFTNDFINAIRDDRSAEFQSRYRSVDILLVDDIQFIQGKEQTMEEFFHTFNALYNANKQVVLTSDLPPKQLSGIEDRLRSRFSAGLLTDVQPPDLETRIAILQKKAGAEGLDIDSDVLEFIASRISSNIRELEGSLLRVTAFAALTSQHIDRQLAELVLKDIISDPNDTEITPALIMGQTAHYFDVSLEQLSSTDRTRTVVEARQIAMYLCRELTDLSLPNIGKAFGGRDHTTVMHANKKISKEMAAKRDTYNQVTELINRIKREARNP